MLEIVLQATSSDDENPYDKNIHNVFIILHKLLVSVWYCVETSIFNNFFVNKAFGLFPFPRVSFPLIVFLSERI